MAGANGGEKLLIAIDGPSGVGKSTMARMLARRLGIVYVDTGAMYRAVALKAARRGIDPGDARALGEMLAGTRLSFREVGGAQRILLDGEDVEQAIRTPEITRLVSEVATVPLVREVLDGMQKLMASQHSLVMDGRDIGAKVLPNAQYKFFLTASGEVRARRRYDELRAKGENVEYARVLADMTARDERDSTREASPLRAAPDAILIDTGAMDAERVLAAMLSHIRESA